MPGQLPHSATSLEKGGPGRPGIKNPRIPDLTAVPPRGPRGARIRRVSGPLTALSRWSRSIVTGGGDASERVDAITGMRSRKLVEHVFGYLVGQRTPLTGSLEAVGGSASCPKLCRQRRQTPVCGPHLPL